MPFNFKNWLNHDAVIISISILYNLLLSILFYLDGIWIEGDKERRIWFEVIHSKISSSSFFINKQKQISNICCCTNINVYWSLFFLLLLNLKRTIKFIDNCGICSYLHTLSHTIRIVMCTFLCETWWYILIHSIAKQILHFCWMCGFISLSFSLTFFFHFKLFLVP